MTLLLTKYALMDVCNWGVCNGACRCVPIIWAIIPVPLTRAGLCGLIEGRVPVDASSGCPVIIVRAAEPGGRGCKVVALVAAEVDMAHTIEIATVYMNWLITLKCFCFLFLFFY